MIAELCVECGKKPREKNGKLFHKKCWKCRRPYRVYNSDQRKYVKLVGVKVSCEKCGFVANHPCQLDIDHVDGDHDNNSRKNLQILCANCHRIKTFEHISFSNHITLSPLYTHENNRS